MPALDIRMVDNRSSQHRTQVCRINDLPYDVFYLLLVMCWDDAQWYHRGKILHFPVIASHVCRIWRQQVISTPSFWAKLSFQSRIPQFEKYQEWLTRLRGAAFDVHIRREPFTRASVKHAKSIMRLIMPHIFHLRSLRVSYVPTKILRLIFDRLSDANAPLLQTLRVDMLSGGVQGNWKPRPFHRGQVPNLRNVRLDAMPYGYIMDRFGETLSDFIIVPGIRLGTHHDRIKFVQEILLRAPNLRVFGYIRVGNWEPDGHNQEGQTFQNPLLPSITHSSLEKLYIDGNRSDSDVIICSLRLPQVRYLANRYGEELVLGLCCLQTIGLGPFPNLVSLRLGGSLRPFRRHHTLDPRNSPNLAHLLRALRALPELRALTFKEVDFEHGQYLMKCLGTAGCCPRLEWLTLSQCAGYTMQELREVVEARQQLKSVDSLVRMNVHRLRYSNQAEDEARDWLIQMVDLRVDTAETDEERGYYLRSVERVGRDVLELNP